jgi:hypothetical protein
MKTVILARATTIVLSLLTLGLGLARAQITMNTCTNALSSGVFSRFSIIEVASYTQTNASGAFAAVTNAFDFEAVVDLATNLTGESATLTVPGKSAQPMFSFISGEFLFFGETNTAAELTSAYPDGGYAFDITYATSNKITTITVPSGGTLPNAPSLSNYAAAQAIDASADFTLSWVPFSDGGSKDYILVDVNTQSGGLVFQSDSFGCPSALDGTATSILIPANTLVSNQTYKAEIIFINVLYVNTNSTAKVALLSGAETVNETTISTGAGTATTSTLVLTNAAWLSGGAVRFDLATTPGQIYEVQFNEDLSNPSAWSTLLVTDAVSTLLPFTNTPPAGVNAGFYRAVQIQN